MTERRVVIVGASAAGLATAEALRAAGFTGAVVLIGDEPHLPYDRPPLSKQLLAGTEDFAFVRLADEQRCREAGLDVRLGRRAVGLDRARRTVRLSDGEEVGYDVLVIATGVRPRTLPAADGIAGVTTLRTYDDAVGLRARLVAGAHVVIVGAGFIGLEVAATAARKGCTVDVVEPAPTALHGRFPAELVERVQDRHRANGVRFHFARLVQSWTAPGGVLEAVTLDDGQRLPADAAVIGIGTVPAVDWLDAAGLVLDNGVVCDAYGLAADGVHAVGDVANWYHPLLRRNHRVEHRLSAADQARIVAARITGAEPPALDVPFFWTDQYEDKWQLYGYLHPDARLEIVQDEPEAGRLVAVLRRGERMEAVIGRNAARQLIPYRRELRANGLAASEQISTSER